MDDKFDFQRAEDEFVESDTPTLDEAKERREWESDEEREKALDEAVNSYIKEHRGGRVQVKYVGGYYDGRYDSLRKPLRKIMEVALPPCETSPGCFTNDVKYEAYYLRVIDDVVYYVHESKLKEFADEHSGR